MTDRPNPYTLVGRSLLDREYKEIREINEFKEKSLTSLTEYPTTEGNSRTSEPFDDDDCPF